MLIFRIRSNGNGYSNKTMSMKTLIDACTMLKSDFRMQRLLICNASQALEIGVQPNSSTCNISQIVVVRDNCIRTKKKVAVTAVITMAMLHITLDRNTQGRPFCADPMR
jgi:hypothetical protein